MKAPAWPCVGRFRATASLSGRAQKIKPKRRAQEMNAELGDELLTGMANDSAAAAADIVILSVPYGAHAGTLNGVAEQCRGKVLVDLTVPMQPPEIMAVNLPAWWCSCLGSTGAAGRRCHRRGRLSECQRCQTQTA